MLVSQVMTSGAETIGPEETLLEARRMRSLDIGSLVDRPLAAGVVEHARGPGRPSTWLAPATFG